MVELGNLCGLGLMVSLLGEVIEYEEYAEHSSQLLVLFIPYSRGYSRQPKEQKLFGLG